MSGIPLSFVLPVLNEAPRIAALLQGLRRDFPACELLVVDGGSSDDSVRLALPLADQLLLSGPGRAAQMNLGAACARGSYVAFLHADTRPLFSMADLTAALERAPLWGFCAIRLSGTRPLLRVVERAMNLRSRLTRVATGDQMLFVRRQDFLQRGAFAAIELMEDIEFCKRFRRLATPAFVRPGVVTSSRRWEERGVLATILQMWLLRLLYVCGVPARRLRQLYYG